MTARRLILAILAITLMAASAQAEGYWAGNGWNHPAPDRSYEHASREREWREHLWREHERREHWARYDRYGAVPPVIVVPGW